MLPPEAVQVIVDLALTAMLLGSMLGFLFSRMLDKVLDLVLYVIARRARIEAARTRDHSLVPPIK
jgi:hypothetical protein